MSNVYVSLSMNGRVFFIDNVAKTFSDYMEGRWLFPMLPLGDNTMTNIVPEAVSINSKKKSIP